VTADVQQRSATGRRERAAGGVPFALTEICEEARNAVNRVLESGWVTSGPETMAFESELATYLGVSDAVAVSSCTAALELSLRALRLPAGAPVLTPTLTFCGAVHAIVHAGLRPVLVDVAPGSLLPDAETTAAAARRAGRPAAMVVQHMAGYPAPVDDLASAAGLSLDRVVEDAAHGLGAAFADGTAVGGRSAATCLSFYATKNLPIGEGGAVTTNDTGLAAAIREARLHGMTRDAWRRYLPGGSWRYDVEEDGLKANFTDVQAAIGRAQLRRFRGWQQRREQIARQYDRGLVQAPVDLPARPAEGRHAWHLYVVRIGGRSRADRDSVIRQLGERGIGTSVHFIPVHHLTYFRHLLGSEECAALPAADRLFPGLLSLPLHPALSDHEVGRVCEQLLDITTP